ncbi:MAG: hypothetical protein PUB37_06795 [Firmicutes bacterium]|nr:hypothetical protein [Bacillota bacterium]
MKNEKTGNKKKIGGIIVDIITIGMLFAAFGMVFYAGFITPKDELPLNMMALVTAAGLVLLYLIGTCSCLVTKVKNNSLTAGFLAFAAVQLYAVLSNLVVLGCLLIKLYTVEDLFMQVSYVVTTAIVLIGYVVNIIAFSDNAAVSELEDYESEDEDVEDVEDDGSDEEDAEVTEGTEDAEDDDIKE